MKIIFSGIIFLLLLPLVVTSIYSQTQLENFTLEDLIVKKSNEDMLKEYEMILENDPNNVQALSDMGGTLLLELRYEEAGNFLDKALEIEPNFVPALSNMGILVQHSIGIDKALEYFEKGLEVDPHNLDLLFNKSNALKFKLQLDESLDVLNEILHLEPDNQRAISEKTELYFNFPESRIDGLMQSVLRNSDGQLVAYFESDIIFIKNLKGITNIFLNSAQSVRNYELDGQEYYNGILSAQSSFPNDGRVMRTGAYFTFTTTEPQNVEIEYPGITGRSQGYLIAEEDSLYTLFQIIVPK